MYTLYNDSAQVKPACSISRAIHTMVWVRSNLIVICYYEFHALAIVRYA